jgi:acyl-CoA synthetase (AMP-forming)/AMP-acid ligase II
VFAGRPIATYQGLQFPLAQHWAEIQCARIMNLKAASLFDAGAPYGTEASIAKLLASQAASAAIEQAMQTMGGMGFSKEMHLERLWRDARLFRFAPISEEMILNFKDGFLYLTDRQKDMIISGGENIASSEVERVIYQMPQVRDAAVIGVPDARWGERPVAVVVLNPGQTLDYDALAQHCRAQLAGFKVPSRLIVRTELPRNPSGKILKRVLRDELADAKA